MTLMDYLMLWDTVITGRVCDSGYASGWVGAVAGPGWGEQQQGAVHTVTPLAA